MKRIGIISVVTLASVGSFLMAGCPDFGMGECDNGACDSPDGVSGDALADGANSDGNVAPVEGGPMIDAPAGCDTTKDPRDSPACVDDGVGVFVDGTNGDDGNIGSKAKPYKSISKAVSSVAPKIRVYICAGSYADNVSLDASHAPSIYGGFACGSWSYASANAVTVKPVSGYALRIDGVASSVTVADIEFDAPDGTATSVNSIAGFVSSSSAVTMKRLKLVAGTGFSPGIPDPPATNHTGMVLDGTTAADDNGATAHAVTCADGTTSTGGKGAGSNAGQLAGAGTPSHGAGGGTAGGKAVMCNMGGGGSDGDKAPSSSQSAPPVHVGSIDILKGWVSSSGLSANGEPGQGGGGGGNGALDTGGGGSGASGGCGGAGGAGGAGGGASIALMALSSPIALIAATLNSGTGGTGALGADGEIGQAGGAAGSGVLTGCAGGNGGAGSGGNGGGGGAGGVSFALLTSGTASSLDNLTTTTSGAAGISGQGGQPGAAAAGGNAGVLGRPGAGYPLPWSVQTWVPGMAATEADPGDSVGFAHDLAEFIGEVRAISTGGRGFSGSGRGGELTAHDDWLETCFSRSEGLLDVPRLRRRWLVLRATSRSASPDVMSHGDLMPGNVLVARGRLAGVIDAGGLGPADPALDLAGAWHLLESGPRDALRHDLGCDDQEWQRGQAWAFAQAMGLVWYYRISNPVMSAIGRRTLDRLTAGRRAA